MSACACESFDSPLCVFCEGQHERDVRSRRGRWMVVYDANWNDPLDCRDVALIRFTSRSVARRQVRLFIDIGFRAHLRRYRRADTRYDDGDLVITDARLIP